EAVALQLADPDVRVAAGIRDDPRHVLVRGPGESDPEVRAVPDVRGVDDVDDRDDVALRPAPQQEDDRGEDRQREQPGEPAEDRQHERVALGQTAERANRVGDTPWMADTQ